MKRRIAVYISIWVVLVASFWFGLKNDAMMYSIIMDAVLIALAVCMPWSIVKNNPTRKMQIGVIAATGVLMLLAEYLTFSLANNIEFHKINTPEWSLLLIGMFLAYTDTEIGFTMLHRGEDGKKKRLLKLAGKLVAAFLIFSILAGLDSGFNDELLFDQYSRDLEGDYQAIEDEGSGDPEEYVGGFWHLCVNKQGGWYLSIYDNEAGNPGIEGYITEIDDENITIKYDPDYYDQLPSYKWKIDGKYLKLKYNNDAGFVTLTNNGHAIKFERDFDE